MLKEKVFIPDSQDIAELTERQKYLLSYIFYERKFNKINKNDYVSISYETMRYTFGANFKKMVGQLENRGIIEVRKQYIKGEHSHLYKITNKYTDIGIKVSFICNDRKLILRIREKRAARNKPPKQKELKMIYDNLLKLEFLTDEAKSFINSPEFITIQDDRINRKKILNGAINDFDEAKTRMNIYETFLFYIEDITDSIKNKSFRFTPKFPKKREARVYNIICNLPRELRRFLRVNGEPLFNLDIANSQPFFFVLWADKFLNDKANFSKFSAFLRRKSSFSVYFSNLQIATNNQTYSILSYEYKREVNLLKTLTCKGEFYEYLMKLGNVKDRAAFKTRFFKNVIFSKVYPDKPNERLIFDNHFPIIGALMDYCKRDNHAQLPIDLQKFEGDFMFDRIIFSIFREKPKMFLLTIHDSILCMERDVQYIRGVMENEFFKEYQLTPKIKTENESNLKQTRDFNIPVSF
ncbi:MAG: hypothetical protein LWX07_04175 [Bacteroidetes bacterium]|nr:hypothetical protein [Bacteroidota bacterium]